MSVISRIAAGGAAQRSPYLYTYYTYGGKPPRKIAHRLVDRQPVIQQAGGGEDCARYLVSDGKSE
jgi:hypothetical protein